MIARKKVLAICGSTREHSSNLNIIKVIAELFRNEIDLFIWPNITSIPHFIPDLDNDTAPDAVIEFRRAIESNDAVLICTPEYAMGVPGTLKNAIDWTVSSSSFSKKPTALITASGVGKKGHHALMETLNVIEANIPTETQLIISFVKTKINSDGKFTDEKTLEEVRSVIQHLIKIVEM